MEKIVFKCCVPYSNASIEADLVVSKCSGSRISSQFLKLIPVMLESWWIAWWLFSLMSLHILSPFSSVLLVIGHYSEFLLPWIDTWLALKYANHSKVYIWPKDCLLKPWQHFDWLISRVSHNIWCKHVTQIVHPP